ncbi:MAG: DUF3467 domain-containing protein [Desulfobacterota bacterium]|jgi:hypothetical protein|nr:DUF3467 domain-containing protein [Thermodesulfobacteriota bacterium]
MKAGEEKGQSGIPWDNSKARTVYSNAFHAASGREEVVLLFGQCVPAPRGRPEQRLEFMERIVLSPLAAKRFAVALQNAVQAHERTYGSLDKEPPATEPASPRGAGVLDERARLLLGLVGKLEAVYGLERSFKATENTLLPNRFLVTMSKEEIRTQARERLLDICSRIHMPGDLLDQYKEHLSFAKFVHFGFEENEESSIYKAYLEFPPNWESKYLNRPAGADAFTLYLGFKWDASDSQKRALTRYTCYPLIPLEKIMDRLADLYEGSADKESLEIVKGFLETALGRTGYDQILYLEVSEDNNPRRSFDINMYRAKLRLRDLHSLLMQMCRHFSITPEGFHALYDPVKSKRFGHLSGGVDREGKEFLTVYYGVEEHPIETGAPYMGCAGQERS